MGSADIIIYAAIAVFLLVRLWLVLGRRNDDEPQRPNPFITPIPPAGPDAGNVLKLSIKQEKPAEDALPPGAPAPLSLAGRLAELKKLDQNFDEKTFLQGAKTVFGMILEDFAKGDLTRVAPFLARPVLDSFQHVLTERAAAGHTLTCRIDRIAEADIAAATVDGTRVTLTVNFVSHQENVVHDSSGNVVTGTPGQLEEIRDLWVFGRDTSTADPNWILIETKS